MFHSDHRALDHSHSDSDEMAFMMASQLLAYPSQEGEFHIKYPRDIFLLSRRLFDIFNALLMFYADLETVKREYN